MTVENPTFVERLAIIETYGKVAAVERTKINSSLESLHEKLQEHINDSNNIIRNDKLTWSALATGITTGVFIIVFTIGTLMGVIG